MSMDAAIQIKDLEVVLPSGPVLFRIPQFQVQQYEKVLIKGRSGCGKTSFLHVLAGLTANYRGEINVCGVSLQDLSDSQKSLFRRRQIGLIFQKLNLLGCLTGFENVKMGLSQPSSDAEVFQSLKAMDMMSKKDLISAKLSQGEQQRIAVARVLVAKPDLVLADEPTSSLDDRNAEAVIQRLVQFCERRTLIVVSHDQRLDKYFDRIVPFEDFAS